MAFLPNGDVLVTERPGRLRIVRAGVLDPRPVAGVPHVRADGLQGLMDVVLHPQFAENKSASNQCPRKAPAVDERFVCTWPVQRSIPTADPAIGNLLARSEMV
jgi:hypothetical protein